MMHKQKSIKSIYSDNESCIERMVLLNLKIERVQDLIEYTNLFTLIFNFAFSPC